jgi:hypothetical protein
MEVSMKQLFVELLHPFARFVMSAVVQPRRLSMRNLLYLLGLGNPIDDVDTRYFYLLQTEPLLHDNNEELLTILCERLLVLVRCLPHLWERFLEMTNSPEISMSPSSVGPCTVNTFVGAMDAASSTLITVQKGIDSVLNHGYSLIPFQWDEFLVDYKEHVAKILPLDEVSAAYFCWNSHGELEFRIIILDKFASRVLRNASSLLQQEFLHLTGEPLPCKCTVLITGAGRVC